MVREILVIAILCVSPALAYAQTTATSNAAASTVRTPQFTVSAASAGIYQSPTTASPVIGNVARGTVLVVTRELGSWVRVPWPAAPDGVAYVHVSMGSVTQAATVPERTSVQAQPAAVAQQPAPVSVAADRVPGAVPIAAPPATYIAPPVHRFGVGARLTGVSNVGLGATARLWSRDRFGAQFELSHNSFDSSTAPGSVSSLFFGANALFSLRDHVSDYFSVRPYAGGGAGLQHQTLGQIPGTADTSSNGLGAQALGGAEVTFASLPQLGVSAEAGYRWSKKAFPGFDVGGFGLGLSAHWYIR